MNKDWKAQLYNIEEDELDTVVWRYLTFPKFIHLISYGALWFCRLQHLIDEFEGKLPHQSLAKMREKNEETKRKMQKHFPSAEHQRQIEEWPEKNVSDGKSLTAVNCWFIGDSESEFMWNEYVGSREGVAVKSTIRAVRDSVFLSRRVSFIGPVKYVDFDTYQMSTYEAAQAHHRAFLKDRNKFSQECELRLSTMNIKTLACLDPIGRTYTKEDIAGKNMNNFDSAGLQIRVDLKSLFDTVVLHPESDPWFKNLIHHLVEKSPTSWTVADSELKR